MTMGQCHMRPCHLSLPSEADEQYLHGRSSDSAGYLLAPASQFKNQCFLKRSFLHTAAGQFRILTGFPFKPMLRSAPRRLTMIVVG